MSDAQAQLRAVLSERFGSIVDVPDAVPAVDRLLQMASHRSVRDFADTPVDPAWVRLLMAVALSSPSKSDLQQVDLLHIDEPSVQQSIGQLIPRMPWIATAPVLVLVCGNARRLPEMCAMHELPFANDHLDAVFNPAVDAGIVLSALLVAAEAMGLRGCPVSVIRDQAPAVASLVGLPQRVFPVAGLCLGWPAEASDTVVPRLPLQVTVHGARYAEPSDGLDATLRRYDHRRACALPDAPAWTRSKAEKFSQPERDDWGRFLRTSGMSTD